MVDIQITTYVLALEQNNWFTITDNSVVYLLSFLSTNVTNKFWHYFGWVEHVVTQRIDKWHDEGSFCCFLCLNMRNLLLRTRC